MVEILGMVELIVGVLMNAYIGKIGLTVFGKDDTYSRALLRVIGIF